MKQELLCVLTLAAISLPAAGGTINYVDWTSSSTSAGVTTVVGTLPGGISVTYTGETAFVQTSGGTNYYAGFTSVYTNAVVSNMPPDSDMIAIVGASSVHTVTFSAPVTGLIMDIVSLGQPSILTNYTFDQTFSILSMGPGWWGGPGTLIASNGDTTLTGVEGDGVIQFGGTFSTLNWTGASGEYWNGFTFGVPATAPVPEPATWSLLLAGLAAAGLRHRHRSAR